MSSGLRPHLAFRTLWIGLLIALHSQCLSASPCTLYKPQDIETARENAKRYPWALDILEGWAKSVAFAVQQDRAFFDPMIPDLTPWPTYGQNCPVCVGRLSSMGECGIYDWSVTDPDRLTCRYCRTVYPNSMFPETGTMTCPKMGQSFTYFETEEERAHPGEDPKPYAFRWAHWPVHTSWTGVIRARKIGWCAQQILPLAKLYAITGEALYAERCAWILDRFAKVYPNWLFHSYNGTYADCPPAEAATNLGQHGGGGRFPKEMIIDPLNRHQAEDHATLCNGFWGSGRYGCSGGDGDFILNCLVAYDLIRDARLQEGTPVLSAEMDERITRDLLLAGWVDSSQWQDINNKCGPGRALGAAVGVIWDRPESVRWALSGFERLMAECFHFDGFCQESPSYSGMHLSLMEDIPEILRGYSDPEGFVPEEGTAFKDLDPFRHTERYRLALESMVKMLAPDGLFPVIGDTHSGGGPGPHYVEILTDRYSQDYAALLETVQGGALSEKGSEYALWHRDPDLKAPGASAWPLRSEWFPGWQVGVLRGEDPQGPNALYFNGYAYHGHRHQDTLGIVFYAWGKEMASDRGYIWDDPRNAWTSSTLAHNLVTVDEANQAGKDRTSSLELMAVMPGVQVIQARSDHAYEVCDVYRRTCALVQLPGNKAYVLDIFRVRGGNRHRYGLQCNGNLVGMTGPAPEPLQEEHKWLSHLRASFPQEPFTATWEDGGVKLDLTLLSPIQRLVVADAPGWRSDRGSDIASPAIQQVFAERSSERSGEALDSRFVAVLSGYQDTSPVLECRLLDVEEGGDAIAVSVRTADRTDILISCMEDGERTYGPVSMQGQFGFVSLSAEKQVLDACLVAGTGLTCGESRIALKESKTALKVDRVEGRTFYLRDKRPPHACEPGSILLAQDTGFEIEASGKRWIRVRDYPAMACDEVVLLHSATLARAR